MFEVYQHGPEDIKTVKALAQAVNMMFGHIVLVSMDCKRLALNITTRCMARANRLQPMDQ